MGDLPQLVKQRALACTVCLFSVYSVAYILDSSEWGGLPRDLDVVELWSGAGTTAKAAQEGGLKAAEFDKHRVPGQTDVEGEINEDFTTLTGFKRAVSLVMRLRPGGLLGMGPDCSSFGFSPSSVCQRRPSEGFVGDQKRDCVKHGNLMANAAALFLCLALARDVHFWFENPAGSMIFSYLSVVLNTFARPGTQPAPGKFDHKQSMLTVSYCDRCAYITEDQRATENYYKKYKFMASGAWIQDAMRTCKCGGARHTPLMEDAGLGKKNGRPEHMKKSGEYPISLGRAIVRAWSDRAPGPGPSGSSSSSVSSRSAAGIPRVARAEAVAKPAARRAPRTAGVQVSKTQAPQAKKPRLQQVVEKDEEDEDSDPWSQVGAEDEDSDPWDEVAVA